MDNLDAQKQDSKTGQSEMFSRIGQFTYFRSPILKNKKMILNQNFNLTKAPTRVELIKRSVTHPKIHEVVLKRNPI